jgi:hypothetical protein
VERRAEGSGRFEDEERRRRPKGWEEAAREGLHFSIFALALFILHKY